MAKPPPKSVPPELTATDAAKVLVSDLANILKKVKSGKPLSAYERKLVADQTAQQAGAAPVLPTLNKPHFATTITDLAGALGVTRRTVQNWRKLPDAPKPGANGRHPVPAWKAFAVAHGLKHGDPSPDIEAIKKRLLTAKADLAEFTRDIQRGLYKPTAEIEDRLRSIAADLQSTLRSKLEQELPPKLAGLDATRIQIALTEVVDQLCARFQRACLEKPAASA